MDPNGDLTVVSHSAGEATYILTDSKGAPLGTLVIKIGKDGKHSIVSFTPNSEAGVINDARISYFFNSATTVIGNPASNAEIQIIKTADNSVVDRIKTHDEEYYSSNAADGTIGKRKTLDNLVFGNGKELVVVPHTDANGYSILTADTEYKVVVPAGAVLLDGNPSTSATEWTFRTNREPVPANNSITVDPTGNGNFSTIKGALDFLRYYEKKGDWTISVATGIYHEILYYKGDANITLHGMGAVGNKGKDVVVTWKNADDLGDGGARGRSTFLVQGGCSMVIEGMTFINSYDRTKDGDDGSTQAETLSFDATGNLIVYDSSFKSHQDTLYIGKHKDSQIGTRAWFYKDYVEGDVDFIWGYTDVALFEDCDIHCLYDQAKGKGGTQGDVIFASRSYTDGEANKGFVLMNSRVTSDEKVDVYYARSSGADTNATIIHNTFDKVAPSLYQSASNTVEYDPAGDMAIGYKDFENKLTLSENYIETDQRPNNTAELSARVANREYNGRTVILNRGYNVSTKQYRTASILWDISEYEQKYDAPVDTSRENIFVEPVFIENLFGGQNESYNYSQEQLKVYDFDNNEISAGLTYESSDSSKATVNSTGLVKAVENAEGLVAINVTAPSGKKDSSIVKVISSPVFVTNVTVKSPVSPKVNLYSLTEFSATQAGADGGSTTHPNLTWTLSGVDPEKACDKDDKDIAWFYDADNKTFVKSLVTTEQSPTVIVYARKAGKVTVTATNKQGIDGKTDVSGSSVEIDVNGSVKEFLPEVLGVINNGDTQKNEYCVVHGAVFDGITLNGQGGGSGKTAKFGMKAGNTSVQARNAIVNLPVTKDATVTVYLKKGEGVPDYSNTEVVPTAADIAIYNYVGMYPDGVKVVYDPSKVAYVVSFSIADATAASLRNASGATQEKNNTTQKFEPYAVTQAELDAKKWLQLVFGANEVYFTKIVVDESESAKSGQAYTYDLLGTKKVLDTVYDAETNSVPMGISGTNVQYNGGGYGYYGSSVDYTIPVGGDATVIAYKTYGGGDLTLSAGSKTVDTFTVASGDTKIGNGPVPCVLQYKGGATNLKLNTPSNVYIAKIVVVTDVPLATKTAEGYDFTKQFSNVSYLAGESEKTRVVWLGDASGKYKDSTYGIQTVAENGGPTYFTFPAFDPASVAFTVTYTNGLDPKSIADGKKVILYSDKDNTLTQVGEAVTLDGSITSATDFAIEDTTEGFHYLTLRVPNNIYISSISVAKVSFEEQKATISMNDMPDARDTAISTFTIEPSGILTGQVKSGELELTSKKPGSAAVTIRMENEDIASFDVTVDPDGTINIDKSGYSYWITDKKTLSLNDLGKPASTDTVISDSEEAILVEPEGVVSVRTVSENKAIEITSEAKGSTQITVNMENGDVSIVNVSVSDMGVISIVGVPKYTSEADKAKTPTVEVVGNRNFVIAKNTEQSIEISANTTDGGTLSCQWLYKETASSETGTKIEGADEYTYTQKYRTPGVYYLYAEVTNSRNGTVAKTVSETFTIKVFDEYTLSCNDLGLTGVPEVAPASSENAAFFTYKTSGTTTETFRITLSSNAAATTETPVTLTFTADTQSATADVSVTNGIFDVEVDEYISSTISLNRLNTTVEYSDSGNKLSNANDTEAFVYLPVELGNDVNVSITADVTYSSGSYAGAGFVSIKSDGTLGGYAVATNNKIRYRKAGGSLGGATFDSGSGISGASHGIMTATCKNGTLTITVVDDEKAVSKKNWSASYHVTEGEKNYLALGGQYANLATFSNIKVINGDKKYRVNSFQDPSEEDEPSGEVVTYILNANEIATDADFGTANQDSASTTKWGTSEFFSLTNKSGSSPKKWAIEEKSTGNYGTGSGSGISFTKRLKTGGKEGCKISFTTTAPATLEFEAAAGGSSDERKGVVHKAGETASATPVGSLTTTNDQKVCYSGKINLSEAGEYYIWAEGNAVNFFWVKVSVSSN